MKNEMLFTDTFYQNGLNRLASTLEIEQRLDTQRSEAMRKKIESLPQ
jgi:hypothetical protein